MTLDDIRLLKVPVPYPVRATNCYLVQGTNGWDIIDTGAHTEAAVKVWSDALEEFGIGPGQVRNIYITHYHPDHIGMVGWLQERVGGTCYMHRLEAEWVPSVWNEAMPQAKLVADAFRRHGMSEEWAGPIQEQFADQYHDVTPLPTVIVPVEDGDRVPFGDGELQVVWTPGHSDGHMCLWSEELSVAFTGDHILTHITPNVGLWPKCHTNPLQEFLESLKKVVDLHPQHFLPGHGRSFEAEEHRIEELLAHHEERLGLMADTVGPGHSAFEVCCDVFGTKLSAHQMRFAMAETLSHLTLLETLQRVAEKSDERGVRYQKRAAEGGQ